MNAFKYQFPLTLLLVTLFTSFAVAQVKTIKVEKENLIFTSEPQFTEWLSKVQFIQPDKIQLYYHNGYRFKIMPDGKIFRTHATLNHTTRKITWISKANDNKSVQTVLKIDDRGNALLTKGSGKTATLKIQAR